MILVWVQYGAINMLYTQGYGHFDGDDIDWPVEGMGYPMFRQIHIDVGKKWFYREMILYIRIPVVPHKAVAEVSKIGNL